MNTTNGIQTSPLAANELVLTPDALIDALKISAPSGFVTVKGIAAEVKFWSRNGEDKVLKVYGRLVLGDASIRFELQPNAAIQDNAPVILYGALRIKKSETFRTTHEVILVGDVVGRWIPYEPVVVAPPTPLVRQQPRLSLEAAVAKHGLDAIAIFATGTAWNDLTTAANPLPVFAHCRRVETNFMKPEQFLSDLAEVCRDPAVQVLVIARGGGGGLEVIGDSPEVAAALLASKRPFYTALGHDDNVLLLDKHADRAFSTPSILGQMLAETIRSIAERQNLEERLSKSTQENASLTEQLTQANAKLELERRQLREPVGKYDTGDQPANKTHAPAPRPGADMRKYAIWGVLLLIVFVIGRCST
ncbi:exodeoxyribonuclease VII large subunit [Pseudomonas chlororaphis]|uniref:exodeoxyribonuclease VII large subunit n=1 Tax=Pseudomonas chlororaphis TaxID=587753 RepID=UPI0004728055|nr:exodeoxyribonuclease VII large subunit [Pseudomonas chlororaphis]